MPAGRPETRASGYCTSPGRQAPQEQPAGLRAQARARPLAPSAWQAMLRDAAPARAGAAGGAGGARAAQPPEAEAHAAESARPEPVVLDVRNAYEWDAGHFVGSERPLEVRLPAAALQVFAAWPSLDSPARTPALAACLHEGGHSPKGSPGQQRAEHCLVWKTALWFCRTTSARRRRRQRAARSRRRCAGALATRPS